METLFRILTPQTTDIPVYNYLLESILLITTRIHSETIEKIIGKVCRESGPNDMSWEFNSTNVRFCEFL